MKTKKRSQKSAISARVAGALIGVHAGDSLGATLEFKSWQSVRLLYPNGLREIVGGGAFSWKAGQATDDTDLTRAVLLAYLDSGRDVVKTAGNNMLAWYDGRWPGRKLGQRPRDIGGQTASGLARFRQTQTWLSWSSGKGGAGNGSLMRCIPTALARRNDPDTRWREAAQISAVTHSDPRCVDACVAYCEIVSGLINGSTPDQALVSGFKVSMNSEVQDAIRLGLRLDLSLAARTGENDLPFGGTGYVLDSLSLAVAALVDERPAVDVLVDVTRLGGDSDTNGAIAGGLLGARDGMSAWPRTWVSKLQFAQEFQDAAAVLARGV